MTVPVSLILMRNVPELLVRDGWEVHIVSSPGEQLTKLGTLQHVVVHPLPMERDPSPLSDAVSLARWVVLLRKVRPDVVSVSTPKASLLGALAAKLTRAPRRIYLQRGLRLETATGMMRKVLIAAERATARSSHTVLAVSPSLRSELIELGIAPSDKVTVLGSGSSNGVDVELFANARNREAAEAIGTQLGLDRTIPVVGFVGRVAPDKGLKELAEARKILLERGIEHQLLIVGGVDSGVASTDAPASEIFGPMTVTTGAVENTAPYYALMDVFCLPTYREGFPNVVLEASAAGVPTVTTDATGAVDSVKPETTGLIVPARSGSELAGALATLLLDPERRRSMGAAAQRWVNAEFRRDQVARQTTDFYAQELERAGGRTPELRPTADEQL
ncbi:glycosyltransferase family 4 protein [Leifsonia sp. NCR5]|uniref:glycosyltransferase family 4 protein n=1 Tax=Leifsonia sp. NCR5 TaxID=1978342 RepID=UPI0015C41929|nr:glycosyltransferase family 4 protein [Leifsonia sp. NCR5]